VPEPDREAFFRRYFDKSCSTNEIEGDTAAALIGWIASGRDTALRLLECYKSGKSKLELLVVEIDVSLGQRRPANAVLESEKIGLVFGVGTVPSVFPLRTDFPIEVPHLNIAMGEIPESLCLFDLPADEVLRILSPVMLIERTRWWLRETAHGRLHGDDQPLDPLFAGNAASVILPELSTELNGKPLVGFKRSNSDHAPILVENPIQAGRFGIPPDAPRFSCIIMQTPPVAHGRLRSFPCNMAELIEVYRQRDIDLVPALTQQFRAWLENETDIVLFQNHCLLIVATPIERTPGQIEKTNIKGFFASCDATTLAEAVGAVISAEGKLARPIIELPPNLTNLQEITLEPANIHMPFGRRLALESSGLPVRETPQKVLLIGAGALGSQVAITAARSGIGEWEIVDPDHLLPHNFARHGSSKSAVGVLKAEAVAADINGLLGLGAASGHGKDIQLFCEDQPITGQYDVILDISASVPVARWLSGNDRITTEVISAFVNPTGTDLVLLREGIGRKPRLDHLKVGEIIMPSGGCRRPSLKIAQSKISIAAAQAVEAIFGSENEVVNRSIEVRRQSPLGITRFVWTGSDYDEIELDGWRIAISKNVVTGIGDARAVAGKMETGGILIGSWDRHLRKGWIVAHQDPPPDSEHSPTSFVRGSVGVYRSLASISEATAANLGYIGEWHTHPNGHSNQASSDDALLMRWIGTDVQYNDVPALMMIGGDNGLRIFARTVGCSKAV
jgi:hypothetical protein